MLKRIGGAAAKRIVSEIGEDAIPRIIRQLDDMTEGAISRLIGSCGAGGARVRGLAAPLAIPTCPGLSPQEVIDAMPLVGTDQKDWDNLVDLSNLVTSRGLSGYSGGDAVRALLKENATSAARVNEVARALLELPEVFLVTIPC